MVANIGPQICWIAEDIVTMLAKAILHQPHGAGPSRKYPKAKPKASTPKHLALNLCV